jgi:hypothetical protein
MLAPCAAPAFCPVSGRGRAEFPQRHLTSASKVNAFAVVSADYPQTRINLQFWWEASMVRAYCFDFMNHDGSIDQYDIGAFGSDAEAERQARDALLVSTTAVAVEIWKEGAQIGKIRRSLPSRRPLLLAV